MLFEEIINDSYIVKQVEHFKILSSIEYIVENTLEENETLEICINNLFNHGTIQVYIPKQSGLCNYVEKFFGRHIEFICIDSIKCTNNNLSSSLETLCKNFYVATQRHLYKYLFEDVEYMEIVLKSGKAVIVQGFEKSVAIPQIRDVIFIAHTHPIGYPPIPSKKDLYSMRDLIAERGIGGCIYSTKGSFCMYRTGIPTWKDYELLTIAINRYEKIEDICTISSNIKCFVNYFG